MSASTITRTASKSAAIAASIATAPRATAVVVPTNSTTTRHAAATRAAEQLTEVLAASTSAGLSVLVKRYGADIDMAAVRLARRAALQLAGAPKGRGQGQQNIANTIAALEGVDALTDSVFVAAARNALNAHKQAEQARRDKKKGYAATVNDKNATPAQRLAALEVLTGMDAADTEEKKHATKQRFLDAITAMVAIGYSRAELVEIVTTLPGLDAPAE
jgi:hypothetical protein